MTPRPQPSEGEPCPFCKGHGSIPYLLSSRQIIGDAFKNARCDMCMGLGRQQSAASDPSTIAALHAHNHRTVAELDAERRA